MEVALKTYHKYQLYSSLCYILLKSCHLHQTLTQSQCMPSRDRIGIPVNILGRCLYRYIYIYIIYGIQNSITNTWNNEVRKKRGRVINGCYPCDYQYMWSATIKIDTDINCSYISDQLATWDVGKWLSDQLCIKTLIYRFCSFE